jgi:hypothetical protein
LLESSEEDASLEDSGAKTFSNGSSLGGAKGLSSHVESDVTPWCSEDDCKFYSF